MCCGLWAVPSLTPLSLPLRAGQKLEEQDKKAVHQKEQLQRERRYLRRRLEQLAVQGLERLRTHSLGSSVSTDHSDHSDSEQGQCV